jgi:hypothetical protein|tara:strand:- start:64 stop:780 length:717 start_codon:yes stop_codon:yes gene_type:complete
MQLTAKVDKPAGLYLLPRMAAGRIGRWWHKHNIDIFTRMIRHAILFNEVDPNRVYIMGISQGGYGSCHLAPFLADLFAGAGPMDGGMMTMTENLRNLAFRSDIGEFDKAYNRIELANKWHSKIDSHKVGDPRGTASTTANRQAGWRNRPAIRIREKSSGGASRRLDSTAMRRPLKASKIVVHLNAQMLDLDKEVTVRLNGKVAYKGMVERSRGTMMQNLVKRGDVNSAFPAEVIVGEK